MRRGRLVTVDTPKGLQRQAMGGEVIHLQVELSQLAECRRFLETLPEISRVENVQDDNGGLHAFCEDAGKGIPPLLAALKSQLEITPQIVEPYVPAFDEVFVRLIRAAEKKQVEEALQ
jgi:hypothetical protein